MGCVMRRTIRALAVLLLLPASAASAADDDMPRLGKAGDFTLDLPEIGEEAAAGWYARFDAGYARPAADGVSINGAPVLLGGGALSGWSLGGGLGYRFTDWLRAEASIDYLHLGHVDMGFGRFGGGATVALASGYWDMVTLAGFTPYLGAGLGFAISSLEVPAPLMTGGNDWQFAWMAGAGVSYAVGGAFSIDLGYRYVSLGAPGFTGLDRVAFDDLAAHQIRIGLRFGL